MTDVIDPVEALRVFVEAFERARDRYSRRYPDRELGYRWFDEMPSDWPMEMPPFAMKDFRAARAALTAAEAAGMVWVPKIATPEMVQAHFDAHARSYRFFADAQEVWDAMLKAARPSLTGPEQATREGENNGR